jgi:glucosamine--fructose-6-phosphate aminotransferase (isomerizing)
MTPSRTTHPYYMYEEIQSQPAVVAAVLAAQADAARRVAAALRARVIRRVIFTGTGTSLHAAECATWFARVGPMPFEVVAMPAYDLATYPFSLASDDAVVVISHRGTKRYAGQVLQQASAAGVFTVLITGQGEHQAPASAVTLRTCAQDRSAAHTVSYTSALAVLALLLAECAQSQQLRRAVLELPRWIAGALEAEAQVRGLTDRERIYFVGGGPHAITAREAALKVKETAYLGERRLCRRANAARAAPVGDGGGCCGRHCSAWTIDGQDRPI